MSERDVPTIKLRSLLAFAMALPAFVGGLVLLAANLIGIGTVPAGLAALVAALATGFLLVTSIAAPIDEAVELARRFDAGETEVRLDPSKGLPQFRLLARILNRIADQIVERDLGYELVSKATEDAVWDWDRASDRVRWHGQLQSVFGLKAERFEASLDWWRERIHPDDRQRVDRSFDAAVEGNADRWSEEYRFRLADGTYRWFWDRSLMVSDETGRVVRGVGCMTDISERRASEERIWQLATHDELTGCPNRTLFQRRLTSLLRNSGGAAPRRGSVLLIDVDDFKLVNDLLGHDSGDKLLQSFAERLEAAMADKGLVFRLGGDEFAVILPGIEDPAMVESVAEGLLEQIREPFVIGREILPVRTTIGAVIYPKDGASARELMKNADIALYSGKAAGRNRVALFELSMRQQTEARARLHAEIRTGIEAGRFGPHYQPIISLTDGRIAGVEALMRWQHPTRGMLGPSEFACAYDDLEIALQLGKVLLDAVVNDYQAWADAGGDLPYVAINISTAGFSLPNLAERLIELIGKNGIPPSALVVEVTETVLLSSGSGYVQRNLQRLNEAGIRIALDDFGTGYASLTHLQQYPVDIIKIDRSFVSRLTHDEQSHAIVGTMLELGRRLGKTVIAEGVETLEQAQILRAGGCTHAQGFLFAKPMPAEAFTRFSRREQPRRGSAG